MRRLDRGRIARIELQIDEIERRRSPVLSAQHLRAFWLAAASVPGWCAEAEQRAAECAPIPLCDEWWLP